MVAPVPLAARLVVHVAQPCLGRTLREVRRPTGSGVSGRTDPDNLAALG